MQTIVLNAPLVEGAIPKEFLSLFASLLEPRPQGTRETLTIQWDSNWFDLSVLSQFALLLNQAKKHYYRIELDLRGKTVDKVKFLWQCGFWDSIQANFKGSNLACSPDPWKSKPSHPATTFSPIYVIDIPNPVNDGIQLGDDKIKYAVEFWNDKLRSAECFHFIENTDIVKSREYLYLLMWELIHNAYIHSGSSQIAISGQFFLSPKWLREQQNNEGISTDLLNNLTAQYEIEKSSKFRPERNNWIKAQKNVSFLLLTCVDTGIGIPKSLERVGSKYKNSEKLKFAFTPWSSTRRQKADLVEAHGLSQIIQLANTYDGYLFVESGNANLNWTREDGPIARDTGRPLVNNSGTRFEVLLPLLYKNPQIKRHRIHASLSNLNSSRATNIERSSIFISGERKKLEDRHPGSAIDAEKTINSVLEIADEIVKPVIFLDFGHLDAVDRQFASSLLRKVRIKNSTRGIVVINASDEFLVKANFLSTYDHNLSEKDIKDRVGEAPDTWRQLDEELSTILSRGASGSLPLLTPVIGSKLENMCWLGLGSLETNFRKAVESAIEYLILGIGESINFEDLRYRVERQLNSQIDHQSFRETLEKISRWNPWLLETADGMIRSILSPDDLIPSNKSTFVTGIVEKSKHQRQKPEEKFVYSLSWHKSGKRLRREYYQTWKQLSNKQNRMVCAEHLVYLLHSSIGVRIAEISCVVSATPSAGLLGREISNILGLPFFEAPSFYDVETFEWLPKVTGRALIVDDVLDTGELTKKLVEKLHVSGCEDGIVVTLIQNKDTAKNLTDINWEIIASNQVSLGQVDDKEAEIVYDKGLYYEINPHTLNPELASNDSKRHLMRFPEYEKERLAKLVNAKSIHFGHFVHGGHHFNVYMSLVNALKDPVCRIDITEWVAKCVRRYMERKSKGSNNGKQILVYPYSSPIYRILPLLQMQLSLLKDDLNIQYVIAQPRQLSGRRTDFILSGIDPRDLDGADVLFLDDGIGSGATISGIIDEVVKNNARKFHAVILFDRIGLQTRRHLKTTHQYKTPKGHMESSFESYISINDRAASPSDCIDCLASNKFASSFKASTIECFRDSILESRMIRKMIIGSNEVLEPVEFSAENLMRVLEFRHAVFSDEPTPRQIEISLEGRKGPVRLCCLATLMADPKLFRQLLNQTKVSDFIKEDFCHKDTDTIARSRFIVSIISFVDEQFAYDLVFKSLPLFYRDFFSSNQSIAEYFDKNFEEFTLLLGTLFYLGSKKNFELRTKDSKYDLENWLDLFRPSIQDRKGTVLYYFHIKNLFMNKDQLPLEYLRHLYANFSGSYKQHRDSYRAKLNDFFLKPTEGGYKIIKSLLSQITAIQSATPIVIEFVSGEEIERIQEEYDLFNRTGSKEAQEALISSIRQIFLPKDNVVNPAALTKLINYCTQSIAVISSKIEQSLLFDRNSFSSKQIFFDQKALDNQLLNIQVIGLIDDITHCINNLIDNAIKAQSQGPSAGQGEARVSITISRDNLDFVNINVRDWAPCKIKEDTEDWFRRSGGLSMHRSLLRKWGGDISVQKLQDGKIVGIHLSVISTDK